MFQLSPPQRMHDSMVKSCVYGIFSLQIPGIRVTIEAFLQSYCEGIVGSKLHLVRYLLKILAYITTDPRLDLPRRILNLACRYIQIYFYTLSFQITQTAGIVLLQICCCNKCIFYSIFL